MIFTKKRVVLVLIIIVIGLIGFGLSSRRGEQKQDESGEQSGSENVNLGAVEVGASFTFLATDSRGNDGGEVNFRITKAEKTKEVLVQGRPANAKGEKAFLVLHIEIDNSETEKRYIAPVDVLRLVGEDDEKFAPDIHSEVVEIQPISTKITRVGFVVSESQNSFVLQIGELEGEKQSLEINF